MLTFIGLGLYDERSITVEGRDALRAADRVYAEFYTSQLIGTTIDELESYHDLEIEVRIGPASNSIPTTCSQRPRTKISRS